MKVAPFVFVIAAGLLAAAVPARALLPPPSPQTRAKMAEDAAKAKWSDQVAAYQLCQAQNRVAAFYYAQAQQQGRPTNPPVATPPCVNPGPFTYQPTDVQPGAAPKVGK